MIFAGLGLAVVARIVEQLGGQLRVESEVNKGSRFSFLIPLSLSVSGNVSTTSRSSASPRPSSNMSMTSPSRTQSTEIENLVNALSSSHLYTSREGYGADERRDSFGSSSGRPRLEPRSRSAGVSDLARSASKPTSPVRADTCGPGASILPTLSSLKGDKRLIPVEDVDVEDPSKLRVLIVEVRNGIIFQKVCTDSYLGQ